MSREVLPSLSNTKEAAAFLARRAVRGRGLRRVKEAAGGFDLSQMGSDAMKWITDPKHMAWRAPLVGAGVGGVVGGLSSLGQKEEDRQPLRSALTGALGGGAIGLGGVAAKGLYDRYGDSIGSMLGGGEGAGGEDNKGFFALPPEKQKQVLQDEYAGVTSQDYEPFEGAIYGGAAAGTVGAADVSTFGTQRAAGRLQRELGGKSPLFGASQADKDVLSKIQSQGASWRGREIQWPWASERAVNPEAMQRLNKWYPNMTEADVLSGSAADDIVTRHTAGPSSPNRMGGATASHLTDREMGELVWQIDPNHASAIKPKRTLGQRALGQADDLIQSGKKVRRPLLADDVVMQLTPEMQKRFRRGKGLLNKQPGRLGLLAMLLAAGVANYGQGTANKQLAMQRAMDKFK